MLGKLVGGVCFGAGGSFWTSYALCSGRDRGSPLLGEGGPESGVGAGGDTRVDLVPKTLLGCVWGGGTERHPRSGSSNMPRSAMSIESLPKHVNP